jgi:hypothetical protein
MHVCIILFLLKLSYYNLNEQDVSKFKCNLPHLKPKAEF